MNESRGLARTGSPEAGNYEFTQAFKALVGRQLRYVHRTALVC